jgi:hypothetical protein
MNMNGYYSIGGMNGLGNFSFSLPTASISSAVQSVASLKHSATPAEKEDIKAGIRNVGLAQVKSNKNGWPFFDSVIDQVNSEMGSSSSGGGGGGSWFGDLFSRKNIETFVQTGTKVGLTLYQKQEMEKAAKKAAKEAQKLRDQRAASNYRPPHLMHSQLQYRPQPSGTPGWVLPVAIVGGLGVLGLGLVIALK